MQEMRDRKSCTACRKETAKQQKSLSVIILNINGFYSPIKGNYELKRKHCPTICCLEEINFRFRHKLTEGEKA